MRDQKRILWISSYPKSGNTWIRIFLDNLLSDSPAPLDINTLSAAKIASSRLLFDNYTGVNSSDLTTDEIERYRPEVYRLLAQEAEGDVLLKVHDAWRLNSLQQEIFPSDVTKGVIYVIRNPLDVAVSNAFHHTIDFTESVERLNNGEILCNRKGKLYNQFRQDLFSWKDHVLSWVDQSGLPVIIVRYEDLFDNPIEHFTRMLSFMNWNYSENAVKRAVKNSEISLLQKQERDKGFREKPLEADAFFRLGRPGSWKEELSSELVQLICQNNKVIMERFGYSAAITDSL